MPSVANRCALAHAAYLHSSVSRLRCMYIHTLDAQMYKRCLSCSQGILRSMHQMTVYCVSHDSQKLEVWLDSSLSTDLNMYILLHVAIIIAKNTTNSSCAASLMQATRINMQLQLAKCQQATLHHQAHKIHTRTIVMQPIAQTLSHSTCKTLLGSNIVLMMVQPLEATYEAAAIAPASVSSFNGPTSLRLVHTFTLKPSPQNVILHMFFFVNSELASTCRCNSRHHGHSFIQQGACATDSDWHIGCGGVFNVCEGPLWNDDMHPPVACSH